MRTYESEWSLEPMKRHVRYVTLHELAPPRQLCNTFLISGIMIGCAHGCCFDIHAYEAGSTHVGCVRTVALAYVLHVGVNARARSVDLCVLIWGHERWNDKSMST